jgi:hypothetical protein
MNNSIIAYELRALNIVFSRFFRNYFGLIVVILGSGISILTVVLIPVLSLFLTSYFINYVETGKSNIMESFKKTNLTFDRFLSLIITGSLVGVIKLVGYTIFYFPGLVFSYALAPKNYLITVNENIKTSEVIELSFKYMKGHKFRLFLLGVLNTFVPIFIVILFGGISFLIYYNTGSNIFLVITITIVIIYVISLPLIFIATQLTRIMLFKNAFKGAELPKVTSVIKTSKKEINLEPIQ